MYISSPTVYISSVPPLCISLLFPHCVYLFSSPHCVYLFSSPTVYISSLPPLCISLPPLCISSRDVPHGALLADGAAGGDGGNGTATISTKAIFDREKQKYYYIPIVMWDMRGKNSPKAMTGTNTLTVTVADINDNRPKPGHQDIFVYNYKGGAPLTRLNLQ